MQKYNAILRAEINLLKPRKIIQIAGDVRLAFAVSKQLIAGGNRIREVQIIGARMSVIYLSECCIESAPKVYDAGFRMVF